MENPEHLKKVSWIFLCGEIMKNENYIKEIENNLETLELELETNRKNKSKNYQIVNYCLIAKLKFLREKLIVLKQ